MKDSIKKFYDSNRELIEIATITFVVTGLVLNINTNIKLAEISLEQIKFFLLLGSVMLLIYLLFAGLKAFVEEVASTKNEIDRTSLAAGNTTAKERSELKKLLSQLMQTTFVLILFFLFTLNLAIYILVQYMQDFIFIIVTFISYGLFFLAFYTRKQEIENSKKKRIPRLLALIFMLLTLVLIPLASYVYLSWGLWIITHLHQYFPDMFAGMTKFINYLIHTSSFVGQRIKESI